MNNIINSNPEIIENINNDKNLGKKINNLYKELNNENFFRSVNSKLLNKCVNRRNKIRNEKLSFNELGINIGIPFYSKCRQRLKLKDSSACSLCNPFKLYNIINKSSEKITSTKLLSWREYYIEPNKFPYMDNQILIFSKTHLDINNEGKEIGTQYSIKYKEYKNDIFDYFILINRNISVFFNGVCGNSLNHFHFHSTTLIFPIEKYLKEFKNNSNIIHEIKYNVYGIVINHYCYRGIYLKTDISNKLYLKYLYSIYIDYFIKRGYYISFLLYRIDNELNFVLFIQTKSGGPYGASDLAGYFYSEKENKESLKENSYKIINTCNKYLINYMELLELYNDINNEINNYPDIIYLSDDLRLEEKNGIVKLLDTKSGEWYSQINKIKKTVSGRYLSVIMHFLEKYFKKNTEYNILELGLGAGSIPYHIGNNYPQIKLTAIEYSHEMIYITKNFIFDETNNIKYIENDAFKYINSINNLVKYDIIIDDLFINDNNKPEKCKTNEYLLDINKLLKPNGIFISNQSMGTKHIEILKKNFVNVKFINLSGIITHKIIFCWNNTNINTKNKYIKNIKNTNQYHIKTFNVI